MNVYEIKSMAERLSGNTYPGRGIVLGVTPDGKTAVAAYFIMGRSVQEHNQDPCHQESYSYQGHCNEGCCKAGRQGRGDACRVQGGGNRRGQACRQDHLAQAHDDSQEDHGKDRNSQSRD